MRLHLQVPGHFVLETIGAKQCSVLTGGTTRWLWCWLWAGRVRLFGVHFLPDIFLAWHLLHVWSIRIGVIVILQVCSQRSITSEPNGCGAVMHTACCAKKEVGHVLVRFKLWHMCWLGPCCAVAAGVHGRDCVGWRGSRQPQCLVDFQHRHLLHAQLRQRRVLLVSAHPGMW